MIIHFGPPPGFPYIEGFAEPRAAMDRNGDIWCSFVVRHPTDQNNLYRTVLVRHDAATDTQHVVAVSTGFRGGFYAISRAPLLVTHHFNDDKSRSRIRVETIDAFPAASSDSTPTPAIAIDTEARNQIAAITKRVTQFESFIDKVLHDTSSAIKAAENAVQTANHATNMLVTREDANEIAWAKALDAIAYWWNEQIEYKRKQLFNVIHNRIVLFHERGLAARADQKEVALNKPESLRM